MQSRCSFCVGSSALFARVSELCMSPPSLLKMSDKYKENAPVGLRRSWVTSPRATVLSE